MEILFALLDKVGIFLVHSAYRHETVHFLDNLELLLLGVQIGHLSVIQQIGNILVHLLINRLNVTENEHRGSLIQPDISKHFLQFFSPVLWVNLQDLETAHGTTEHG